MWGMGARQAGTQQLPGSGSYREGAKLEAAWQGTRTNWLMDMSVEVWTEHYTWWRLGWSWRVEKRRGDRRPTEGPTPRRAGRSRRRLRARLPLTARLTGMNHRVQFRRG